jgi:KUP system potassium uptake protein
VDKANQKRAEAFQSRVKMAGLLIATGIVFGDIGTSPLYTYEGLFHPGDVIEPVKALGVLSCVIWTLTLQTTVKYILVTLEADNHGEGGIFSLYTLIKPYYGRWVVVLAVAGGSFLIADGIITPPISVTSAIEGLKLFYPHVNPVPITIAILVLLFSIQQFGTQKIGKAFGPVMMLWFTFIGVVGFYALTKNLSVIKAVNPSYAWHLLVNYPKGFWLLGGIFLCTTGAEALYSDMGHVGRNNIRISWIYIKITLLLSYAGQTAWLLNAGKANAITPFFNIVPVSLHVPAVALATLATIIASQALISGCFTLANEAIHLKLWPRHQVIFPSNIKGQLYIPFFNWSLMAACIAVVLYFQKSIKMEAAFGLSVTLTMLSTTLLVTLYQLSRKRPLTVIIPMTVVFLTVELSFLTANLRKFAEGGWIMLTIGCFIAAIMFIWRKGSAIQNSLITYSDWEPDNLKKLIDLSHCTGVSLFSTHLIYFTSSPSSVNIENIVLNSIFTAPLKKADIYWFFYVEVTDDPFTLQYKVRTLSPDNAYHVVFKLGFRVAPRFDLFFRKVAEELMENGEIKREDRDDMRFESSKIGGYKFIFMNSAMSFDNELSFRKNVLMYLFYHLKAIGTREDVIYGLDSGNIIFEKYSAVYNTAADIHLERIK